MLTEALVSSFSHQPSRQTRVRVYTTGGTQIGLAALGERSEALAFPAHWNVGIALESKKWARLATAEELAEDPWPLRFLPDEERPSYLVHKDGSVAFGSQCIGLKGDILQAVTVAQLQPQPIVERMKADLSGIKTPPTPRSSSDDDNDPDHDYEHGVVMPHCIYKVVSNSS